MRSLFNVHRDKQAQIEAAKARHPAGRKQPTGGHVRVLPTTDWNLMLTTLPERVK